MNATATIEVRRLSKSYRIWRSAPDRLFGPVAAELASWMPGSIGAALRARAHESYQDFFALENIAFSVGRSESVGILGKNGSGKSTLLQIIAGTLRPTSGDVALRGRAAALLELGAGFNPEFTGRENVYLNGSVIGLTRRQIDAKFDEIASFADIGSFMEQPVKTYSSGMAVRLAFAVQTAVEPEVLIVDEALAVGDEAFQRKCFSRIQSLRLRGTTMLLVSHDIHTITRLCSRALLLHEGHLVIDGHPGVVGKLYQKLLYSPGADRAAIRAEFDLLTQATGPVEGTHPGPAAVVERSYFDPAVVSRSAVSYESRGALIDGPRLLTADGREVNVVEIGGEYRYSYRVTFSRTLRRVVFACALKTKDGIDISGFHSHPFPDGLDAVSAGTSVRVEFDFKCLLNPGTYFANAGVLAWHDNGFEYVHRLVDCVAFRVVADEAVRSTAICQLVSNCTWDLESAS